MTALRVAISRLLDPVLRRRRETRLDEELQAHLDLLAAEHERRGLSPAEAHLAAKRSFGGVDQIKELHRERRGLPIVDALSQDLRFAARLLARDRSFAVTAVIVLGLGIGVNNMMFTIVYAHTLRSLPIFQADRVLHVSLLDDRNTARGLSYPEYVELADSGRAFSGIAAFASAPAVLVEQGLAPERVDAIYTSASAFALIGHPLLAGRAFTPDEERSALPLGVLSETAWQRRYGNAPPLPDQSTEINGGAATMVGIMPERSGFPNTAALWLPLSRMPGLALTDRSARPLTVIGRVREGAAVTEAQQELASALGRSLTEHAETSRGLRARIVPVNEFYLGNVSDPAWRAFTTVGVLVVLISCANVANLLLARSTERTRELALRTSLGASRWRIVRQLFAEAALLAAVGAVLGLGVSLAGVRLFASYIPDGVLPYWLVYTFDGRLFAGLVAVAGLAVFLFGLVPALFASRVDPNRVLKDGGRTSVGRRGASRWATSFLVFEIAIAVLLLVYVAIGIRDAGSDVVSDHVVETRDVLTTQLSLPAQKYATPALRGQFLASVEERLQELPNVRSAAVASTLPRRGAAERRLYLSSQPLQNGALPPVVRSVLIGPRYFETLDLNLLKGRAFAETDGTPGQAHAIVNQPFVDEFLAGVDPIGQRVALAAPNAPAPEDAWLTVVGVAPAVRQRLVDRPDSIVYVPWRSEPPATASLLVRSSQASALVAALRSAVATLDHDQPLHRFMTMKAVIDEAEWTGQVSSSLIRWLAIIALGLSTVGLYSLTSHGVSQRTNEIGVRMALGARASQVGRTVLRGAMLRVSLGLLGGMVVTMAWGKTFFDGTTSRGIFDPLILAIVSGVLVGVMTLACVVPVRRATRLDPVAALRHE